MKPDIRIQIEGNVPIVNTLRILGMYIQSDCKNGFYIKKLKSSASQTMGLIRRISNKYRGMNEADTRRLVQAFVISRIVYCIPYAHLDKREEVQINILVRQAYKTALNLPISTATNTLDLLGIHNTVVELKEAHLTSQRERLSKTEHGRAILSRVGSNTKSDKERIESYLRASRKF